MLLSDSGTNARRPISLTSTATNATVAAASTATRTTGGGSKSQSIARLTQKAAPRQATAVATPSIQI